MGLLKLVHRVKCIHVICNDTYIDILKVNGREKEIEIIIAETPKIEEAFNKLYQIVINGNYKFD